MANDDEISSVSAASRKGRDIHDRRLPRKPLINTVRAGEGQQSGCTPASCIARAASRVRSHIRMEKQWRKVDCSFGSLKDPDSRFPAVCRNRDETTSREVTSETGQDVHTVAVVPKPKRMIFRHSELTLFDSRAMPGIAQATRPRRRVCAMFHSQCGILHVNVSWTCLCGCYQGTLEREHDDDILVHDDAPVCDATIARRSVAPVHSGDSRATSGASASTESTRNRLAETGVRVCQRCLARSKTSVPALQPWKVRRVIEYIDANISEPIFRSRIGSRIVVSRQVSPQTNSFAHIKSNGRRHSRSTRARTSYVAWSVDFKSQSKPTNV